MNESHQYLFIYLLFEIEFLQDELHEEYEKDDQCAIAVHCLEDKIDFVSSVVENYEMQ